MAKQMNLQEEVNVTFLAVFDDTPLSERLQDVERQAGRMVRYTTEKRLRETTGNALASIIQLCNERDWDVKTLVQEALERIVERRDQYRSLGRKTRVAILGGAFNPITQGHIQLAQYVLDVSGYFDEVWFQPCYDHLYGKDLVSPEHRLAMCRLAAQHNGMMRVSDYEIRNQLRGETFNTVKRMLEDKDSDNCEIAWIIGMDNANDFETKWVNHELLEKMIPFVVVPRAGIVADPNVNWYRQRPHIFLGRSERQIMDTSSTQVLEALKKYWEDAQPVPSLPPASVPADSGLHKWLCPEVLAYIIENGLYQ